ncbi:MAG: Ig-like domain-containing protein [Bacteroidales bacterium]|nr:Ig-like domain-containing protein [Bacteroidales bacterium]
MWTGKFSRYLLVLLCAFGSNAVWGQHEVKTAKYYFNEYKESLSGQTPTFTAGGDVPVGVSVVASGFTWALKYQFDLFFQRRCTDRVVVNKSGSTPKTASISFSGFKYEVKHVEWNVMCDVFAGKPDVSTTITSEKEETKSGAFSSIDTGFDVCDYPGTTDGLGFKGLKSLVINDNLTTDYCRVFIKAGTGNNYAFQISYYEPSVSFKSSMPSQIKLGKTLDVSNLYTINHPGAFDFAKTATFESSDPNIFTVDKNGVITPITTGKAKIKVTVKDGEVKPFDSKEIEVVAPNLGDNKYVVSLKYNDGTTGGETVIATYGQPMPTITVPTRPGYEFYGYFTANDYSDYYDVGTRYYNSDGTSAKKWDKKRNETLYAHWKSAKYIVTFDINGGIMQENTQYDSDASMSKLENFTDQLIKISFTYGHGGADVITNAKPKMGGFKCIGFYDDDDVLVASINPSPYNYNITINKNNKYWSDGNWNWPHDVTFTARYEPKFTYENNVLDFGTEYLEIGKDWSQGVIHDVVDAARYLMTTERRVSADNPVMVVNLNNANYLRGDKDGGFLKEAINSQSCFSPNLLVYLDGFYNLQDNQIEDGKCSKLVVTDRYEIKVPYAFKADKALYERNKNYSDKDAAKAQAANSKWGTLCLPYPIKNNTNNVRFYQLAGLKNNYMHFTPMEVDVIPANTPVLYKRLEGVGSEVKIEEASVDVPVNTSYSTNLGESYDSWQFVGTLTTKMFCGKDYKNVPEGAEKLDGSKEFYYFKQDKFTHLSKTGSLIMLPYRAYFTTTSANAKFTTFSIIAMDEEGATDITNLIDNDAEGDGKIYDLNGRRVMQPVSGRLYIVNGQKKVY